MKFSTETLSLFFLMTFAILFLELLVMKSTTATTLGNHTDKLALLEFKSQITDDSFGVLASWNDSVHHCQWNGVTCGQRHLRVTSLALEGQKLAGTISPHVGNLSFLHSLNLASNSFYGGIPPEVGRLFRLRVLNLSYNPLGGEIPANLSHCFDLVTLILDYSHLERQIPSEIGSLSKLVILSFTNNNLTGRFPASLGNLSSLQQLSLNYNNLEGEIPDTVAQMTSLTEFQVGINNLFGVFPPPLYNVSSLNTITLTSNNFSGYLRTDLGLALPNLQLLWMGGNQFTGPIPVSLSNASNFQDLNIPRNHFTGNIPLNFGNLQNLSSLGVSANLLGSGEDNDLSFLTSLTNCSNLQKLAVSYNQLGGELPNSMSNLSSQLTSLYLGGNNIGGSIPTEISRLINLNGLGLEQNLLTGNVPDSIGKLSKLNALYLGQNKLTGHIPSSFGNLTRLLELYLYNNSLEGSIPSSLAKCKNLQTLHLCHNKFNGTLVEPLLGLSSVLIDFNVSHNSLTGFLPPEVGDLKNLVMLDVSHNKLSGAIPRELGRCLPLEQLYLQGNHFQGTIPDLGELKGIQYLDLSSNNLTGQIPSYMVNFSSMHYLNLSFNDLEGEVPIKGVLKNASEFEVFGNSKLCGGIKELHLGPCPVPEHKESHVHIAHKLILLIVIVVSCFALMLFLISLYWTRKLKKKPLSTSSFGRVYPKISYEELLNATDGFSLTNLIGSGSFGTVYKGILGPEETTVAVKVLNLQQRGASKSFMAECQALRNIQHRNLVKVITACSSIDFKGNDFKALVYEFMPNGSLENWLHPVEGQVICRNLDLLQRINIAIDVASALHYLHHQCRTPVVHRDLKPSNVLLDNDLTAHVSDFGMARLLFRSNKDATPNNFSSAGIKGTIGYAAPEYGMGSQVSTWGDVYSYGILLLEMLTGRRPTDELFKDDLNLHNFAKRALPGKIMEIVDQSLHGKEIKEVENGFESSSDFSTEENECLISIVQVGVACSAESPRDRVNMGEVVLELLSIKERYVKLECMVL